MELSRQHQHVRHLQVVAKLDHPLVHVDGALANLGQHAVEIVVVQRKTQRVDRQIEILQAVPHMLPLLGPQIGRPDMGWKHDQLEAAKPQAAQVQHCFQGTVGIDVGEGAYANRHSSHTSSSVAILTRRPKQVTEA